MSEPLKVDLDEFFDKYVKDQLNPSMRAVARQGFVAGMQCVIRFLDHASDNTMKTGDAVPGLLMLCAMRKAVEIEWEKYAAMNHSAPKLQQAAKPERN